MILLKIVDPHYDLASLGNFSKTSTIHRMPGEVNLSSSLPMIFQFIVLILSRVGLLSLTFRKYMYNQLKKSRPSALQEVFSAQTLPPLVCALCLGSCFS